MPENFLKARPPNTPGGVTGGAALPVPSYVIKEPAVPGAQLVLELSAPQNASDLDDLEFFETLLTQYGALEQGESALTGITLPAATAGAAAAAGSSSQQAQVEVEPELVEIQGGEDLKGQLVLVDEETGKVLGQLETTAEVSGAAVDGQRPDAPVLLDFGPIVNQYAGRVVQVEQIPPDEMNDWILRGAHYMSQGILYVGGVSSNAILQGANVLKRNIKAKPEATTFSPTTQAAIRRTHNATVSTVKVTKGTIGMINKAVDYVVDRKGGAGKPAINPGRTAANPSASGWGKAPAPAGPPPVAGPSATASKAADPPPYSAYDNDDKKGPAPGAAPAAQGFPDRVAVPLAPGQKRPFLNRVVLAGEVVLSSLEAAGNDLISAGTVAASSVVQARYGDEAGHATALLGGTVRNVALVYVDVRGIGRRGILKATARGWVKARLRGGQEVRLQPGAPVAQNVGGEFIVGVPQQGGAYGPPTANPAAPKASSGWFGKSKKQ